MPLHKTLETIPGATRDQFGNLHVVVGDQELNKPREFQDYVASLSEGALAGTNLGELLDWMRWGAPEVVMWESTLDELLEIITKWERDNPAAEISFYTRYPQGYTMSWEKLWSRAIKDHTSTRIECECGEIYSDIRPSCPRCGTSRFDSKRKIPWGPRGESTYNLVIPASGDDVARTCFGTKADQRIIPVHLQYSSL